MVTVEVNGERRTFEDGASIATLLAALEVSANGMAVEVNREIVPRRAHGETVLRDGDSIEIVTFVGGG